MNIYIANLLLVEDGEQQRRLLRRELEQEGYEVTEAQNVSEAIAHLDRREFDIVICDMDFNTEKTGLDVARTDRLQSPFFPGLKTVFIMYTAFPSYRDCVAAIKAGVFDYVSKLESDSFDHLAKSCREGLEEKRGWTGDSDANFVRNNWNSLLEKYGENWIAVTDAEVIFSADSLSGLYSELRSRYPLAKPYIIRLEGKDSHYV
ncbi:MAG: response regulator [Chthoniobacter sp.]|uniref:response regulator n=1 Tax=Chthoniobacter sp. TaxID=2510640 RepID=UPI0032A80295